MERNKKKKGLESEPYKKATHTIVKLGAQDEDIKRLADIYQKAKRKKRSCIATDTFVIKTAELFEYLLIERKKNIPTLQFGFADAMKILEDTPEILTRDLVREVKGKLEILDKAPWGSDWKTNEIIKKNGKAIFKTSNQKVQQFNAILEDLQIEYDSNRMNLAEFFFKEGSQQVKNSVEKVYYRLQFMKEKGRIQNRCISKTDFNRALRASDVFEKQNGITDETLKARYPLPEYDEEHPEKFKEQIRESLWGKSKGKINEGDRGE